MTIIVFLVDTSASMCQRAHVNGVQKTYLDIAKGAVETFLKFRQRSQDCMGDRYMLLTFEDPPNNVKAGWKENHATFMNELKNLQSNGLTSMGEALKNAFDLLNLNRMQSGIDTYGQGRCPFYLEPSVIIVLTDGGKYAFRNGVHQEIILPLHAQMPGTKLTKEPFRWDQRLFSLVLRMPGNRVEERADGKVPHDDSMIEKMCEVTGGRSYKIKSHYVLNQCIESLVQKVQPGVVIHFDQLITNNGDTSTADLQFQSTKRMIYVPKQHPSQKTFPVGYWPIPEPYWPDPKLTNLPPRDAHPKIKIISPCCDEPQILRNFPIDKYELEASPLTLQILSKKESNKVWPLIVSTGMQGEMPFGYLKPNSTLPIVHLYVLPYNYQMLLPLINDLFHKFNLNPPNDWVYKFTNYVKTIPQYYCPFLRRALATTPNVPYQLVQYILPENLDSYLCPAVANYLKQMKNTAKQDQENLCTRVLKQLKQPKPAYHQLETVKLMSGQSAQKAREFVSHPMLKETFSKVHSEIANYENYTIVLPTIIQTASTKNFRNPYDIPRRDLIDEIARMRENFFRLPPTGINLVTKDSGHCLPISDMGNYQEYLKNKETPLRELEPTNVRQHMFGNPYKKDKNMVMVDEADLNDMAPIKSGSPGPHPSSHMKKSMEQNSTSRLTRKRKAGPIRKDYIFKRSSLDVVSTSSCSLARDGMHMHSDMSSDDESSSTYSGISDTEDDTEGCLVMALDATENDPAQQIGFVGNNQDAQDKGVKKVGPESAEKIVERQSFTTLDTVQSSEDSQLSGVVGTGGSAYQSSSPSKSEKMSTSFTAASGLGAVAMGFGRAATHSFPFSIVSQSGEDSLECVGDVNSRRSQSPSSSKRKQSKSSLLDVGPKEQQTPLQEVAEPLPPSKKRQMDAEGQTMCSDGHLPEVPESVHIRKKPRLQQPELLTKSKKPSPQVYPDVSEQPKKTVLSDSTPALLPETLLPVSSAKQDDKGSEQKVDPQRSAASEVQEQTAEEQQLCKQPVAMSNIAVTDLEPPKRIISTGANERLELSQQVVEGVTLEQNSTPSLPERSEDQPDRQRDGDLVSDPNKKLVDQMAQSVKQSKANKQQRQLDPVEHSEHHSVLFELKSKPEDTKTVEQHSSSLQAAQIAEPTITIASDHSQEQKGEPQETVVAVEHNALPRKPPQQPLETAFQQRSVQRSQSNSQWSLTNSVSSIADANSDMADVQKISNILKTCHNGGDDDRGKEVEEEDGTSSERLPAVHDSARVRSSMAENAETMDSEVGVVLANGTGKSVIVTNGREGAPTQPTLNWDYNVALYSCVQDEDELEGIEAHNMKARSIVFRDIRRPGRDYSELLKHMELIQGNRSCKKKFVDMCINEARRFRRLRMIDCIQQWWEQHLGNCLVDDPNRLYFSGDEPSAVGGYHQTDGFMGMPARVLYVNSGINSVYGVEFRHNNHHFDELVD